MEYYSAIKRNEMELFVVRWMDLESVIQSEVSQKEKNGSFKLSKMVFKFSEVYNAALFSHTTEPKTKLT